MLWAPVIYGYWKDHELWDGSKNVDDWLRIMEVITIEEPRKLELQINIMAAAIGKAFSKE